MSATAAPPFPAPAARHPRPRDCPVAGVEAALLLLTTGRVDMARRVLEGLPELLARAERERLLAENEELRGRIAWAETVLAERRDLLGWLARTTRELADLKSTMAAARQAAAKPLAKPHERLAAALASGTVTAERLAGVLRVDPPHIFEVASGRVGLAPPSWKRVMAELETEAP